MDTFQAVLDGFAVSLHPVRFFYCFLGTVLGTVVGVLPGLGPSLRQVGPLHSHDPEVHELDLVLAPRRAHPDVRRLDVTVDDAVPVEVIERFGDLAHSPAAKKQMAATLLRRAVAALTEETA